MAKPRPKTCHTQILQLFSIFRFFLWFRYTNAIDWNTSFASPVTLSMFFTMGVWLTFHASKRGADMKPLKKFNFSFSSSLIKIRMCLSCKRVVVASVYQRSFDLINYFFQNRSLTLNMSEIGTPPLCRNKKTILRQPRVNENSLYTNILYSTPHGRTCIITRVTSRWLSAC